MAGNIEDYVKAAFRDREVRRDGNEWLINGIRYISPVYEGGQPNKPAKIIRVLREKVAKAAPTTRLAYGTPEYWQAKIGEKQAAIRRRKVEVAGEEAIEDLRERLAREREPIVPTISDPTILEGIKGYARDIYGRVVPAVGAIGGVITPMGAAKGLLDITTPFQRISGAIGAVQTARGKDAGWEQHIPLLIIGVGVIVAISLFKK